MKIVYKGVDISTEEKFLGFVDSINQQIQKQVINQDSYHIKEPLDKDYLLKRYQIIVSRNKKSYLWLRMVATDVNTFKNWHEDVKPTVYVNWRNI